MGLDTLRAEGRKLATLPTVGLTVVLTALLTVGVALMSGTSVGTALSDNPEMIVDDFTPEVAGFDAVHYGQIGIIVLGVLAVSSEYGNGQVRTSLLAVPGRWRFLAAKAGAVALAALLCAVVTVPAAFVTYQIALGEHGLPLGDVPGSDVPAMWAGAVLYWVLMALLAAGATLVSRSALLPLAVLVGMVMALSIFLTTLTDLADYLPDRAGAQLFTLDGQGAGPPSDLSTLEGGAVMCAWVVGVWALAAWVFHRRDA